MKHTIAPTLGDPSALDELVRADQLVAAYRMAGALEPIVLAARDYVRELSTVAEGSSRHSMVRAVLTHLALDYRRTEQD